VKLRIAELKGLIYDEINRLAECGKNPYYSGCLKMHRYKASPSTGSG
jgi:hypothetical protein